MSNLSNLASSNQTVWTYTIPTLEERAQAILGQPVAVISLLLCFLSIAANLFSIASTLLGPSKMATHIKLVFSLGLSDILLSLSVVSHTLNKVFNPIPTVPDQRESFYCTTIFLFALNTMATTISLLNLLAMALDHYVAIMRPLHYSQYLSRSNGNVLISAIWLVSFLAGMTVYVGDVVKYQKSSYKSYCEFLRSNVYQGEYLVIATAFLCFVFITYTYMRIYVEVHRVYHNGPSGRTDYARNRKALLTTLVIIGTFLACWLPTCLLQVILSIQAHLNPQYVRRHFRTFLRLNRYFNTLLLVNTLCDPIVYAIRLRDVQLGYRRLFQKCHLLRPKRDGSVVSRSGFVRQHTQVARLLTADTSCSKLENKLDDSGNGVNLTAAPSQMNGNTIYLSMRDRLSTSTCSL